MSHSPSPAARTRSGLVTLSLACAAAIWVCGVRTVRASDDLFDIPDGTIAFLAMDPTGWGVFESPDPQRGLVEAAVRTALSSGLIADRDAAEVLCGLLAGSVL